MIKHSPLQQRWLAQAPKRAACRTATAPTSRSLQTNRKADLDPALLSRFDLAISFGLPDEACRWGWRVGQSHLFCPPVTATLKSTRYAGADGGSSALTRQHALLALAAVAVEFGARQDAALMAAKNVLGVYTGHVRQTPLLRRSLLTTTTCTTTCRDCVANIACRQLRTRDCKDLQIALYCARTAEGAQQRSTVHAP